MPTLKTFILAEFKELLGFNRILVLDYWRVRFGRESKSTLSAEIKVKYEVINQIKKSIDNAASEIFQNYQCNCLGLVIVNPPPKGVKKPPPPPRPPSKRKICEDLKISNLLHILRR